VGNVNLLIIEKLLLIILSKYYEIRDKFLEAQRSTELTMFELKYFNNSIKTVIEQYLQLSDMKTKLLERPNDKFYTNLISHLEEK
jgi:serine kinase of HPr protein (carbohydrate metabolism regulator)